jgi:hypothetical protein
VFVLREIKSEHPHLGSPFITFPLKKIPVKYQGKVISSFRSGRIKSRIFSMEGNYLSEKNKTMCMVHISKRWETNNRSGSHPKEIKYRLSREKWAGMR